VKTNKIEVIRMEGEFYMYSPFLSVTNKLKIIFKLCICDSL